MLTQTGESPRGPRMVRISGREYRERPLSKPISGGDARRLHLIADSLRSASEFCAEPQRALYKSILQVLAHAENLRDKVAGERLRAPTQLDLLRHAAEL